MSSDLVAFLRERLDEDEQTARAAATRERGGAAWTLTDGHESEVQAASGLRVVPKTPPVLAHHIARHDPARVLREVEAKRLVLTEYEKETHVWEKGHRTGWTEGGQAARRTALKAFAAVYADHPDYREEWRP